eukprot:CAMPEP_0179136820 /NCGR_PEP_ID=MMETSP0796-20121207/65224_1 /TAXON_ID=73915 /ORGANISM="Pyrodinium bahamense, Strain pbaha01" /LENGTH=190 /DNA_ID=CAMNT_0020835937 /DNA_START=67 /DNA_END=636 /DNA_ORIENTATION=-
MSVATHCRQVVLLTGPSGSGKSTVARLVAERGDCTHVSQDGFFGGPFVPYREALAVGNSTIESPSHVDFAALREAIAAAASSAPEEGSEAAVVLVEGHALLCDPLLVSMAARVIYLEVGEAACKKRRLGRRKRSEEEDRDIAEYYSRFVWPAHLEHCQAALTRLQQEQPGLVAVVDASRDLEAVVCGALQ